MLELLTAFYTSLYELSLAMAPYILFGLFFAGLLHELVPADFVQKHLGRDNVGSVVKATLFGVPLPVCSCGVVPLATAIKKSGASNGATLSFLISTPITGVDSILATFGMFGWAFTLYRLLTSMVIAIAAGLINNLIVAKEEAVPVSAAAQPAAFSAAPASSAPVGGVQFGVAAPSKSEASEGSCCSSGCGCENEEKKKFSFKAAMSYGFITLFGDIAKPLFWGLVIGAAITVAVPADMASMLESYVWLSYLVVVAIAIPMYVCATASLPIAASLILAGVSPGAAFVFLSAGPATNTVTIGVVKKMLGTKSLFVYLGTIALGSILFGLLMDQLFTAADIDIRELIEEHEEETLIGMASAGIMWVMTLYFFVKGYLPNKEAKSCCSSGECH